jgi:integrin-linked kinase-associated serine/threonine phosphatase 2C
MNKVQNKYKKEKTDFTLSGTCMVGVLIIDEFILVINLGDSRAVIGNIEAVKDKVNTISALEISIDHKPLRECEKARILKAGGKIEKSTYEDREVGPLRVWKADEELPGIAITRSLGDLIAHTIGVAHEPEITYKFKEDTDKFVIMGSDGVWDVMSSAEAVGFVLANTVKEDVAKNLVYECRERWDLLNEIKKKQTQIMLDNQETDKKNATIKMQQLEKNLVCDDITVVVMYF